MFSGHVFILDMRALLRPGATARPIHLLRTFTNAQAYDQKTLKYQTVIHVAFLISAMAIAAVDRTCRRRVMCGM